MIFQSGIIKVQFSLNSKPGPLVIYLFKNSFPSQLFSKKHIRDRTRRRVKFLHIKSFQEQITNINITTCTNTSQSVLFIFGCLAQARTCKTSYTCTHHPYMGGLAHTNTHLHTHIDHPSGITLSVFLPPQCSLPAQCQCLPVCTLSPHTYTAEQTFPSPGLHLLTAVQRAAHSSTNRNILQGWSPSYSASPLAGVVFKLWDCGTLRSALASLLPLSNTNCT